MDVRKTPGGALVSVRVQPRASRPSIAVGETGIVVRVSAPPVDGRATEEARSLLARCLGVRPGAVTLKSGERSRTKVFLVEGLGPDLVRARLQGA